MVSSTARQELASRIAELSQGVLELSSDATGWPSEGAICLAGARVPVRVFVGTIGESHRNRTGERRFQNPGQGKPITAPPGGIALLLGATVSELPEQEPVVVAMDAYQRMGLLTRFSMFMPVELLAKAAKGAFVEHTTTAGEDIYAFPASRLGDYLARILDLGSIGSPDKPGGLASLDDELHGENSIHIRPRVGIYAAFARLNYKPWYALAEFVDNAVQSFLDHRNALGAGVLEVEVWLSDDEIRISDKAAGIAWADFPRAFSPSQPPPDPSGLSEFGLGMKAAACWFAREWSIRTSAVGDPFERSVRFDVDRISESNIEHLPISVRGAAKDAHYTVVSLRNLRVRPRGRTIGKIKEHLTSIYRVLMERGVLRIEFHSAGQTDTLAYERPELLNAPYFKTPSGPTVEWRRSINIRLDNGRGVTGWAGLLRKASTSRAGFSVFRRDRLIEGSADETYRPLRLFRSPNSYTYQRLVGELFVTGFDVSHTKDGIQWDGEEDELLSQLRELLSDEALPILSQAEGHRVRRKARDLPKGFGHEAIVGAAADLGGASELAAIASSSPSDEREAVGPSANESPEALFDRYEIIVPVGLEERWQVSVELLADISRDWYGYERTKGADTICLHVWINLEHPFSESFVNSDENTIGPLVRLVSALALAEHSALCGGVPEATIVRNRANRFLREHLSGT